MSGQLSMPLFSMPLTSKNVALPFPSLLTELFKKVGINMADNSVCKVIWALDHNSIIRIWRLHISHVLDANDDHKQVELEYYQVAHHDGDTSHEGLRL
ncbi:hypothetical protein TIFTF001_054509 [Ficus carica]|uniref:Uncharacterized protein n=1 Tax=Ficus carica TaxID=3494 RepID=A0AA88EI87_FICCA|nr:hypothetical protein TIFTF001_054509 [Ficus carica]